MTRILVPLDESELAEESLPWAALAARAYGAPVHLISVWNRDDLSFRRAGIEPDEPLAAIRDAIRAYLDEVAARPMFEGVTVTTEVRLGDPAEQVADAASENTRMVVITSHGRGGLKRALRGSVADELIRTLTIPVLHNQAGGIPAALSRMLVTLDGSDESEQALPLARELAQAAGAGIHLLRVYNPVAEITSNFAFPGVTPDLGSLAEAMSEAAESYVATIAQAGETWEVRAGRPLDAIIDCAAQAGCEIIAMATRGRGGILRFALGSTADSVARAADRPVLLVPTGDGDES
jgi:nucleotide-binding universal stress UspA family protein